MPLGQKFFAFLLTIAVAAGVFSWQHRHATQATNAAVLSFDPAAAQHIDPGLAQAGQPAVALAQSILTDPAVATLSKQAYLASSDMNSRIGEFRSRLALSQPSQKVLDVQFTDADPAKSAATANAIANALAAWTPASATAAPAPAPAIQTPSPAPAPAKKPSATQSGPSLSASLGELGKQLSTTNRELDQLGSTRYTKGRHGHHAHEPASYSQARQQQLLNTQVRAAERKLDDLRAQYSSSSPGAKARLEQIRQALVSIWPAGARQAARGQGFNAAGTSTRQLREEHEELTRAIAVVEKQRHAIQAEEAAASPAPAQEPAQQPAAPAPSSSLSESNLPSSASAPSQTPPASAPAAGPATADSSLHPLTLVQPANSATHTSLWPAGVAGLACGLLYLSIAAWRYRPAHDDDATYEDIRPTPPSGFRFITTDEPTAPATPSEDAVAPVPSRRASFTYQPPVPGSAPSDPPAVSTPLADPDEPPSPTEQARITDDLQLSPQSDNVAEMPDPWAQEIRKNLSQTTFARMLESEPAPSIEPTPSAENGDTLRRAARPDRLAG
ncbi:MAG: hypothetical protein WA476_22390 [Acidobacteriaceae bacterium]